MKAISQYRIPEMLDEGSIKKMGYMYDESHKKIKIYTHYEK